MQKTFAMGTTSTITNIRNKMYFNSYPPGTKTDAFSIYIPGRLLCYIFIYTYLADFFKTKLVNEIYSHFSSPVAPWEGLILRLLTSCLQESGLPVEGQECAHDP